MKFNFLFKETKSVLLPNQTPGVVASTFVTTEIERKMMLQTLIGEQKHDKVEVWLSDDYGHCSAGVDKLFLFQQLKKRPSLTYHVQIIDLRDYTKITFFPQVKTENEMKQFANAVRSAGSLD